MSAYAIALLWQGMYNCWLEELKRSVERRLES
jgi:hypothetical protein